MIPATQSVSPRLLLVLPPELWSEVFKESHTLEDLTHLWTTCRSVSHQFRDLVERVFAEKWLRKTYICFQLSSAGIPRGQVNLGADFSFARIDAVTGRASFSLEEAPRRLLPHNPEIDYENFPKHVLPQIIEDLKRVIDFKTPNPILYPRHRITFRYLDNDTELPGVSFDPATRELSFDWKRMYNKFLWENAHNRQIKQWLQTGHPKGNELRASIDARQAAIRLAWPWVHRPTMIPSDRLDYRTWSKYQRQCRQLQARREIYDHREWVGDREIEVLAGRTRKSWLWSGATDDSDTGGGVGAGYEDDLSDE